MTESEQLDQALTEADARKWRYKAEQAGIALAAMKAPCVWTWSAFSVAWLAQCDGWAFVGADDFVRCPRCGKFIKFKERQS